VVKEKISGEMNGLRDIFKCELKPGGRLEIKTIKVL